MRKPVVMTVAWLVWLAGAAVAQQVVLDDSLRGGSTSGVQNGGAFQADGWRVTNKNDSILWHLPTIIQGAVEFSVRGLRPNDTRPEGADKNEIFHMYDYTYNNADNVYDGYRNNPYKHFIRKTNGDIGKIDSMEFVWAANAEYVEPDSAVLSWDQNTTYRFREEWGPDGTGHSVIKTYRDGALIMTMSVLGSWAPAGLSVRIAASTRAPLYADFGACVDAVYSDVKVWSGGAAPPPGPAPVGPVTLGISGDKFTLNGQAKFLIGVSYFDGSNYQVSDFDALAARRFNLIRIWLDWGTAGDGRSFFDSSGALIQGTKLLNLVRAARARGLVVDVTILDPGLTFTDVNRALSDTANLLKDEPNVLFDVMNEHDHPGGPRSHAEVAGFIATVKSIAPNIPVTVSSTGGHLLDTVNIDEEIDAGVQILTPHMPRTSDWYDRTDERVTFVKNRIAARGRTLPVYLQEEARRANSGLDPTKDQFLQAAREARDAGAAAWILHTDAGFDLAAGSLFSQLDPVELDTVNSLADAIYGPGGGGSARTSLASGWEPGEPVGNMDQVFIIRDVSGPFNSQTPPPECSPRSGEQWRTGANALMISGYSNASYAYCYYKLFDDDILIQTGTKLKYWIWHQATGKVAMDGHFTDGTDIRDLGFVDQNGVAFHPGRRTDPLGTWTYVEVDLSAAAGKVLDFILVGFDNGNDGFQGEYRAYIDDFSIGPDSGSGTPPPPGPGPAPSPSPAPGGRSGGSGGGSDGKCGCGVASLRGTPLFALPFAFLALILFPKRKR